MSPLPDLACSTCGTAHGVDSLTWRCRCGGVLDVAGELTLRPTAAHRERNSLWRYESALPVPFDESISLGEGMSPMVPSRRRSTIRLKLDFLMPTSSFKDRGAVVLATLAASLGVRSAMTDSSGNAGTSAAAYLARARIPCRVFVPESTSSAKLTQMRAHGADVVLVPGTRADTSNAARAAAAEPGVLYASHVYHPYFLHGVKTYGYEIWEQSGRSLPDTVVVPVGNGTLLLGCFLAFRELVGAGLAERMPALVGVQAHGCAPVAAAFRADAGDVSPVHHEPTIAEGIAIAAPPRGAQILTAIRATNGTVVEVDDDAIARARADLAADGLYVEPTSAVYWAAALADATDLLGADDVVIPLCGGGLKVPG